MHKFTLKKAEILFYHDLHPAQAHALPGKEKREGLVIAAKNCSFLVPIPSVRIRRDHRWLFTFRGICVN